MLPRTDMRISVNYMYNVWELHRKGIMCAMRSWWWRYSGSPRSHRVGALFPDFCFLNWVISSHHTAASTHTRTYNICSSRCISGTLPPAPLTLRILNINSQERTGFLTLLYLLPLLPGVKRHALSLLTELWYVCKQALLCVCWKRFLLIIGD